MIRSSEFVHFFKLSEQTAYTDNQTDGSTRASSNNRAQLENTAKTLATSARNEPEVGPRQRLQRRPRRTQTTQKTIPAVADPHAEFRVKLFTLTFPILIIFHGAHTYSGSHVRFTHTCTAGRVLYGCRERERLWEIPVWEVLQDHGTL